MKVLEDDKYHSQRLDLIYESKIGIYVISLLCAITFTYTYYNSYVKFNAIVWISFFVAYIALRIFMGLYFWDCRKTSKFNYKTFDKNNIFISALGGLIWGSSTYLFLLEQPANNLLIGMMIYAGICAGGLISNSASLKANLAFTYSILLTSGITFIFYRYPERYSIITLLSLFTVGCTYCAIVINKLVLNNLKLSFKNLKLLEELRQSNAKKINIERQAKQASNLATIGQMASGMAHEINNPLTIIKGNLNLLKRHIKISSNFSADDYTEKSINKCLTSIERIVNVIGSLKKMSQMNFNNPIIEITINEVLNDTLGFINEKLKCSNIKLVRKVENEDVIIKCDSTTTSQLLLSIFSHAFQVCNQYKLNCIKVETQLQNEFVLYKIESRLSEDEGIKLNNSNIDPSNTFLEKDEFSLNLSITQSIANKLGGEFILDKNNPHLFILKLPINQFSKSNLGAAA